MPTNAPARHLRNDLAWALGVAVLSAAAWFGWMGWDDEYQVDRATNEVSGPYEAWQVVGCVLTLLVVGVVAAHRWRPFGTALVLPVAFALAWSVTAASEDDSGLWVVGAVLVLLGTAVASLVVVAVVAAIPTTREPR